MNDGGCIAFLQWALPQRDLRWAGFRKVRRQVCKRVMRRMRELGLDTFASYRARLEADPTEWDVFDEYCHITISRFFRDRGVFEVLRRRVLPDIAARARREERPARIWSAGCASGEEPYTVKILWDIEVRPTHADIPVMVVATDVDATMLARAREACFEETSFRELPPHLLETAFDRVGSLYCVKPEHRDVQFMHQDLRSETPDARFDLILCRYVAFTYFSTPLQQQVLAHLVDRLLPGGYLAIGTHELLPDDCSALTPAAGAPQIFQKREAGERCRGSRENHQAQV